MIVETLIYLCYPIQRSFKLVAYIDSLPEKILKSSLAMMIEDIWKTLNIIRFSTSYSSLINGELNYYYFLSKVGQGYQ